MAAALSVNKSTVSRLVARGMPLTTVEAAQSWRVEHAKPRSPKGSGGAPPPEPKPRKPRIVTPIPDEPTPEPAEEPEGENPEAEQSAEIEASSVSLKFARTVEDVAKRELIKCARSPDTSVEDFRKATSTCISARANAEKARQDRARFLREQGITLYVSEAELIYGRAHQLIATMLAGMPKQISARLVGQPQKEIETTLADWVDEVMGAMRKTV